LFYSFCLWFLFFFFLRFWGLNSEPTPWATPPALFVKGFFKIGSLELFAQLALVLLMSSSWVARIIARISNARLIPLYNSSFWPKIKICP
jgi:hypothetical protein